MIGVEPLRSECERAWRALHVAFDGVETGIAITTGIVGEALHLAECCDRARAWICCEWLDVASRDAYGARLGVLQRRASELRRCSEWLRSRVELYCESATQDAPPDDGVSLVQA